MANLNLSEFTEKLFVADADHTFIWDTQNAISKRVSRNSWLNSGTLTSDAPVTISQTWNNAAVVFTGLKVNAAGTSAANSASGSLLADFQAGGVSQLKLNKSGFLTIGGGNAKLEYEPTGVLALKRSSDGVATIILNPEANSIVAGTLIPNNRIANSTLTASVDFGDGANTFAVRNSTAAQTFNVYGTYTSGTSYERLTLSAPSAANAIIGTNKGSGGGTARGLEFQTDGVTRITISAIGTIDCPQTFSSQSSLSSNSYIMWGNGASSRMLAPSNGIIQFTNAATTGFDRLQFGGTTNLFPAIKRSSTTLQARLADDSNFAPIQGKLTTETAFTATTVTPTGFITLYDSTGAAYKVPCVPA